MTQSQHDELFLAWCKEVGITPSTEKDLEDFLLRGHLCEDPGSDVHDFLSRP